jgi:trimethylamine-N-oxide reductase (cytochrome c)
VLPATSALERDDISSGGTYSNDKIYAMRQVIEPYGESLDDFEIFKRLAELMGVGYQFTEGMTVDQILKNAYAHADPGVPFEEFWEKGHVRLDVPEPMRQWVRHGDLYTDPDANPLHTKSGKIELYCETIANYNIPDCPPIPKFLEPFEYLGNAKPGQVHVVSPHPFNRLHSQMANSALRNEEHIQGRQHVLISVEDARANGIRDGDLVELPMSAVPSLPAHGLLIRLWRALPVWKRAAGCSSIRKAGDQRQYMPGHAKKVHRSGIGKPGL